MIVNYYIKFYKYTRADRQVYGKIMWMVSGHISLFSVNFCLPVDSDITSWVTSKLIAIDPDSPVKDFSSILNMVPIHCIFRSRSGFVPPAPGGPQLV